MKKKVFAAILAALMTASLTACGGGSKSTETKAPETTAAETEAETEAPIEEEVELEYATFEGTDHVVLVDNDLTTIVLESAGPDDFWGYVWNLTMTNNTDADQHYVLTNCIMDGWNIASIWGEEVAAGETKESKIYWEESDITSTGMALDAITGVFVSIKTTDADYVDLEYNYVAVYPNGEASYQPHTYEHADTDVIVKETDSYKISIISAGVDEWGDYKVNVVFENYEEYPLYFSIKNAKINGADKDPYYGAIVDGGCSRASFVCWYDLEEEVKSISFKWAIRDDATFGDVFDDSCEYSCEF